jgi:hypothetical protein
MGMSLEELFELNKNAQISPEAAGAGFAIAVALAKKYHGQETSSIQVLREAGIPLTSEEENRRKTARTRTETTIPNSKAQPKQKPTRTLPSCPENLPRAIRRLEET